jgi:hypothetical protein
LLRRLASPFRRGHVAVRCLIEAAAQYRHAKLGVVATTSFDGKDFASLLEKAILRSRGIGEPQMKVIEHRQTETDAGEAG